MGHHLQKHITHTTTGQNTKTEYNTVTYTKVTLQKYVASKQSLNTKTVYVQQTLKTGTLGY